MDPLQEALNLQPSYSWWNLNFGNENKNIKSEFQENSQKMEVKVSLCGGPLGSSTGVEE